MADTSPCAENIEQEVCHGVDNLLLSLFDKSISMLQR